MENTATVEPATQVPEARERTRHKNAKLTLHEHALIVRCHLNNPKLSQNKIAQLLHVDPRTVSKALRYEGVKAVDLLQVAEKHAAQQWIRSIKPAARKGDHKPAKDLLLHTRAIEPVETDRGTTVQIIFGGAVIPGISIESPAQRDSVQQLPTDTANSVLTVTEP